MQRSSPVSRQQFDDNSARGVDENKVTPQDRITYNVFDDKGQKRLAIDASGYVTRPRLFDAKGRPNTKDALCGEIKPTKSNATGCPAA